MQILHEEKTGEIRTSAFKSPASLNSFAAKPSKSLIKNENISWLICFGIVSFLTGMLKFLKLGVTMDTVTSVFFYVSSIGVFYFLYKIFSAPKTSPAKNAGSFHSLN
ncbi:MAG TPA: hypothetical protein VK772_00485 [Puia sp.]|jgi:hypothetical protein|nr:hypothetical protein [Puia sp.]